MPFCSRITRQLPGVCNASNARTKATRISVMRLDMILISRIQPANSSASSQTVLTSEVGYFGQLDTSRRVIPTSWHLTVSAMSALVQTMCSAPRRSPYKPAFFEKL